MEEIQIKEENDEFYYDLIVTSPELTEPGIKCDLLEIDKINTKEEFIEENINETTSDEFKQQFINKKFAEIYLDLDKKDSLKFICLSCNATETSYDNIFNHIIDNEDTCGNLQIINCESEIKIGEEKFGELFIQDNFIVVFKCSFCHSKLKNKNQICSHLSEHLNECESEEDDEVYFQKKMADVYLLQHSNYKFLYSCNSCNQKRMTFQSISDHLESNIETCGNHFSTDMTIYFFKIEAFKILGNININIKIENDKDDIIDKIHNKVCEIFMDLKRKISVMCLYCCDFYTEMESLSEHLLIHSNNEVIDKSSNEIFSDVLAEQSFIPSSASNARCSIFNSLPKENKSIFKSSLINVVLNQLVDGCCSAKNDSSNLMYLKTMLKANKKRRYIVSELSPMYQRKKKKRKCGNREKRAREISKFSRSIDEYSENNFKRFLGMSKDTFYKIQNMIKSLWLQNNTGRPPYPLKECLFLTLWKLSTGYSFNKMSVQFGMPSSSLYSIYSRILKVILMIKEKVIQFPSEDSIKQIAKDFKQSHSFPSVLGCIGGMHVRILQPRNNSLNYFNQKDYYSLIAQVVVDSKLKFLDAFVGLPGKYTNSDVWNANPLKKSIEEKTLKFPLEGYLLGDETYPLKTYLMVPFDGILSVDEQKFNKILNKTHKCVDHAFKLLKQKFRILNVLKIQRIPLVIHTIDSCIILHNIILENESICEDCNIMNNSIDYKIFEHKTNMNISTVNHIEGNNEANEKRIKIQNLISN